MMLGSEPSLPPVTHPVSAAGEPRIESGEGLPTVSPQATVEERRMNLTCRPIGLIRYRASGDDRGYILFSPNDRDEACLADNLTRSASQS